MHWHLPDQQPERWPRERSIEHHAASLLTLRPDNPITQTGIRSEVTHHGLRSRLGRNRTDLVHQPLDVVIVAGPWVLAGWVVLRIIRRRRRR